MLFILLRKINKNRWMILCLLLGLVLSVGIVSSIPMYSRSILQRVLSLNLEEIKVSNGFYPGAYFVNRELPQRDQYAKIDSTRKQAREKSLQIMNDTYPKSVVKSLPLPLLSEKQEVTAGNYVLNRSGEGAKYERRGDVSIRGVSGFEEHIKIQQGRMYSKTKNEKGEYEVIVSEYAFNNLRLTLDATYKASFASETYKGLPFDIRVVGIYTYKDENDPYWDDSTWYYPSGVIMDYNLMVNDAFNNVELFIGSTRWYFALDYKQINGDNFEDIIGKIGDQKIAASKNGYKVLYSGENVLYSYLGKKKDMTTMLWVLQAPMLLMLLIYLSMMSKLIVEQDTNEISLLKSRGGGIRNILPIYLMESAVMGIIALIAGPVLGRFICKMLGASNGFLQFVQREPLVTELRFTEYLYSLAAVGVFIITMIIPVIAASRKSIVEQKQSKVRYVKNPLWKRFYLDFVLLGVAGYGFYSFLMRQKVLDVTSKSSASLPVDPLLYMTSTIFIIGLGLVFLRVFPSIIKLVFWLGRNKWNPVAYSALINVGRSNGRNQFVMLFLILTICIGIFNVKAAGTLNTNMENNIKYLTGADVVIITEDPNKDTRANTLEKELKKTSYSDFTSLSGVDKATRVMETAKINVHFGKEGQVNSELMTITPHEFGEVAWFKDGLLPYHINEYLNAMTKDPKALLLSRAFEKIYGIKQGDSIQLSLENGAFAIGYAAGFIDYWPSVDLSDPAKFLMIANYEHVSKLMPLTGYDVWIRKKSADSSQAIYEDLKSKQIEYFRMKDAGQDIVKQKNSPMLQGINGSLTMVFVTTMVITIIGFLIYWIMSIKERTLQFGILRSMGLSFKKLIGILSIEQVLISGSAIGVGMLIGELNSRIFVPLLNMSSSATGKQVLPFTIVSMKGQYMNLYVVICFMLVLVSLILARFISRINMGQALKLGED